jgi:hypothetical protein
MHFLDDRKKWKEIARNQENMKRVEMAEKWKSFAFACICEAITVYIQGTEDNREQGNLLLS